MLDQNEYHIDVKISEGSYGEVFKVTEIKTKKHYALKTLELSNLKKQNKYH